LTSWSAILLIVFIFVASKVGVAIKADTSIFSLSTPPTWFLAPVDAGEKQKKETKEEPKGEASNNWTIDSTIFTVKLARPTTVKKTSK
jgi:hypothetical protein